MRSMKRLTGRKICAVILLASVVLTDIPFLNMGQTVVKAEEITPETTPEITPETTPEVTPEVTPETTPEVTPEIPSEVTSENTSLVNEIYGKYSVLEDGFGGKELVLEDMTLSNQLSFTMLSKNIFEGSCVLGTESVQVLDISSSFMDKICEDGYTKVIFTEGAIPFEYTDGVNVTYVVNNVRLNGSASAKGIEIVFETNRTLNLYNSTDALLTVPENIVLWVEWSGIQIASSDADSLHMTQSAVVTEEWSLPNAEPLSYIRAGAEMILIPERGDVDYTIYDICFAGDAQAALSYVKYCTNGNRIITVPTFKTAISAKVDVMDTIKAVYVSPENADKYTFSTSPVYTETLADNSTIDWYGSEVIIKGVQNYELIDAASIKAEVNDITGWSQNELVCAMEGQQISVEGILMDKSLAGTYGKEAKLSYTYSIDKASPVITSVTITDKNGKTYELPDAWTEEAAKESEVVWMNQLPFGITAQAKENENGTGVNGYAFFVNGNAVGADGSFTREVISNNDGEIAAKTFLAKGSATFSTLEEAYQLQAKKAEKNDILFRIWDIVVSLLQGKRVSAYDIELYNKDKNERIPKLENPIMVTVTMPVEEIDKSVTVYTLQNREYRKCVATVAGNQITFSTKYFDEVVLVWKEAKRHTHNLMHYDAVAPTAEQDGNIEYWYCRKCNTYYKDAICTIVTDAAGIVLPATGSTEEIEKVIPPGRIENVIAEDAWILGNTIQPADNIFVNDGIYTVEIYVRDAFEQKEGLQGLGKWKAGIGIDTTAPEINYVNSQTSESDELKPNAIYEDTLYMVVKEEGAGVSSIVASKKENGNWMRTDDILKEVTIEEGVTGYYIVPKETDCIYRFEVTDKAGNITVYDNITIKGQKMYHVSEPTGANGWYIENPVITAEEGYMLSVMKDGEYTDTLTITESVDSYAFYIKTTTGLMANYITLSDIKVDQTVPEFSAEEGIFAAKTWWQEFLENITFELYQTQKETIQIKAHDNESDIATISYYISDTALSLEQLKVLEKWTVGNEVIIDIAEAANYVIYAKVENNAGLVTYISTNGIVIEEPEAVAIQEEGVFYLKKGVAYQLGEGTWEVKGDNSSYKGGCTFYVSEDGSYEFRKSMR